MIAFPLVAENTRSWSFQAAPSAEDAEAIRLALLTVTVLDRLGPPALAVSSVHPRIVASCGSISRRRVVRRSSLKIVTTCHCFRGRGEGSSGWRRYAPSSLTPGPPLGRRARASHTLPWLDEISVIVIFMLNLLRLCSSVARFCAERVGDGQGAVVHAVDDGRAADRWHVWRGERDRFWGELQQ